MAAPGCGTPRGAPLGPSSGRPPGLPAGMLLLLLLGCWGDGAALSTFTMLQLARFPDSSGAVEFWGNASLDGAPTHSLRGFNASQLQPLEPPARWQERADSLRGYLQAFHGFVRVIAGERKVPYPLHLRCLLGCQLAPDGTARSFYEVALNGDDLLSFQVANASWALARPKEGDALATFVQAQVNRYPETTSGLQAFLETTCVEFLRRHSKMEGARPAGQHGRSHTPLALGLTFGAFALAAVAVGVFLCTGRQR